VVPSNKSQEPLNFSEVFRHWIGTNCLNFIGISTDSFNLSKKSYFLHAESKLRGLWWDELYRVDPSQSVDAQDQWSPNYGPRAGFSPPPHLDRPPEQYQRRVPIYYFFSPDPLPLRLQWDAEKMWSGALRNKTSLMGRVESRPIGVQMSTAFEKLG